MLSLRELFLVIAAIAFALAALVLSKLLATAFLACVVISITGFAVFAFAGRGPMRSFSIGFTVSTVSYVLACLFFVAALEGNLSGTSISTWLINPSYELVVRRDYLDGFAGKPLPPNDPNRLQRLPAGGYGGVNGGTVFVTEAPDRETFRIVAHVFVLLSFAYLGGKSATFISLRTDLSRKNECG